MSPYCRHSIFYAMRLDRDMFPITMHSTRLSMARKRAKGYVTFWDHCFRLGSFLQLYLHYQFTHFVAELLNTRKPSVSFLYFFCPFGDLPSVHQPHSQNRWLQFFSRVTVYAAAGVLKKLQDIAM